MEATPLTPYCLGKQILVDIGSTILYDVPTGIDRL